MQGTFSGRGLIRSAWSVLPGRLLDPRLLTWAGIAAVNLGDIGIVQSLFRKAVDFGAQHRRRRQPARTRWRSGP